MTRTSNARLAGFMFLVYIATSIAAMVLLEQATNGEGIAGQLATVAREASRMRVSAALSLATVVDALVLAVALYALTRDEDPDLALLALSLRIAEGVINAIPVIAMMALLSVAERLAVAAADAAAAHALGAVLLRVQEWTTIVGATVFAVGSAIFSYLFLRARSVPTWLSWLGVLASLLLVVALPLQLIRPVAGPSEWFMWMPMLAFEVTLALWLLIKGVATQPIQ